MITDASDSPEMIRLRGGKLISQFGPERDGHRDARRLRGVLNRKVVQS